MNSIILRAATRILMALILIFAIYMLLRGHDAPGGGFIGALISCAAFVLYKFAHNTQKTIDILHIDPKMIAIIGLILALISGFIALLAGENFLTGIWLPAYLDGSTSFPISSVFLFDIGVYLTVIGAILTIIMALDEDS